MNVGKIPLALKKFQSVIRGGKTKVMILAIQVKHMKKCVIKPLLHDAPIFFPPERRV